MFKTCQERRFRFIHFNHIEDFSFDILIHCCVNPRCKQSLIDCFRESNLLIYAVFAFAALQGARVILFKTTRYLNVRHKFMKKCICPHSFEVNSLFL